MRLSDISQLLDEKLNPEQFLSAHSDLFAEYGRALQVRGSTVTVRVHEDIALLVTLRHIAAACRLFVDARLDAPQLAYLADALQLSRNTMFADGVADYVAEFTDPEINGPFTISRAREIIAEIAERSGCRKGAIRECPRGP